MERHSYILHKTKIKYVPNRMKNSKTSKDTAVQSNVSCTLVSAKYTECNEGHTHTATRVDERQKYESTDIA